MDISAPLVYISDLVSEDTITEILNNISDNDINLDFIKYQKNKPNKPTSRKRQDNINKASRKCRYKQKQLSILMKDHIDNMHKLLLNIPVANNISICDLINNYNEQVEKITNVKI